MIQTAGFATPRIEKGDTCRILKMDSEAKRLHLPAAGQLF
jgi:hypothetical protein